MSYEEIFIGTIVGVVGTLFFIEYMKLKNEKFEKEHPTCVCPKCKTKHRKGIDIGDTIYQ